MTLIGPYTEFTQEIYDRLYAYIQKKGLKIAGPLREIYLSNPQETPADQLVTELQIPIAPNL
jgi:effector-binding domain-containing protein